MTAAPAEPSAWSDAAWIAALFAVDPVGLHGVALHGSPGPGRDAFLATVRAALPAGAPFRRLPLNAPDARLLGGLDLAATLGAGRRVAERGILAEADGGVVVVAMAERLSPGTAARLAMVLDSAEVRVERDGVALHHIARIGLIALDEGLEADERPPPALLERLALRLDAGALAPSALAGPTPELVAAARTALPAVEVPPPLLDALCGTALVFGIDTLRAPLLALRATRAAAALAGRSVATEEDAQLAARLVLAPRATRMPAPPEAEVEEPPPPEPPPPEPPPDEPPPPETDPQDDTPQTIDPEALQEMLLAAVEAAIPAGLLASLRASGGGGQRNQSQGRSGAVQGGAKRGRPIGTRAGELRGGNRLNLLATLRAAAPWQRLRQKARPDQGGLAVRREDFRITRFRQRRETTSIFVVDASGSAALHRLAEAKGAVELLLAECYVRRDKVALIAFRGQGAELLLPPTNSLVRAKRSLAALPGGGGTPLAAGIEAAAELADQVARRGATPLLVLLTDGRANVSRPRPPATDPAAGPAPSGRQAALADAMAAARPVRAAGHATLLLDTSPRPQPEGKALAAELGARYLPLPFADAAVMSQAVKTLAGAGPPGR